MLQSVSLDFGYDHCHLGKATDATEGVCEFLYVKICKILCDSMGILPSREERQADQNTD